MISKTSILNFSTFCFFLLCSISQTFAQQNVGFEDGTTANWTCESGTFGETKPADCDSKLPVVLTDGACQNQGGLDGTVNPVNYSQNRHTIMSQKNVKDPNSNNEVNVVAPAALFPSNTNNYSFRIGNAVGGDMSNPNNLAFAEGIKYTFIVTKENAGLTYMFAVFVKESAPVLHPLNMAPSFEIKLTDQAGTIIPCGYYQLVAGSAFGLKDGLVDAYGTWKYADWKKIALDLSGYIGQSVTIEFRTHDCFPSGTTTITKDSLHIDTVCTNWMAGSHAAYAYIDLYSTPVEITAPSVCANQTSVELCAPSGYATYQWPSGQPGIVPPLNKQCVTINNPKPGDMYTVNMTSIAGGCPTSAKVALKGADFLIKDTSVCFYSGPFKLKATPITTG
ncbi:MAG TPA: hypothetical protein VFF27_16810, partial [Bacteroidia bacterium]|nr:hypothetical protein [Bacteroidia bacterium]